MRNCFYIIFAAIIWGTSGLFVKYLNLHPIILSFIRLTVPAVIILSFSKFKTRPDRNLIIGCFLFAMHVPFYNIGFTYTSIGNGILLIYTWPILAAVSSAIILKENITRKNAFLFPLAFIGIIFVYLNKDYSFNNSDFIGMTSMVISAIFMGLAVTLLKSSSEKYSAYEIVFYQNAIGALIFIPLLFYQTMPTLGQIGFATLYATLIGFVGHGLFYIGLKKVKASTASFLAYIEVISALILGVAFLNEVLTWNMALGGTLIIGSTIFLQK